MDLYYKQEVTVGVLVIAAAAILFGGVLWITGRSLGAGGRAVFEVQFTDVNGLQAGDPVQVSGVRVGRVSSLQLDGNDRRRVLVSLEVEPEVRPRADAQASIASMDFFGAKVVDYFPGTATDFLGEGIVVRGSRQAELTKSATDVADRAADVLVGMQDMLSPDMASQVRSTLEAAQQALEVMARLGDGPAVDEATSALNALARVAERMDSTLANPGLEQSLNQLDEVTESLIEMNQGLGTATNALGSILEKMDAGEGSLGRLANDTTLHYETAETLRSMRRLLDDMRERPSRYFKLTVF